MVGVELDDAEKLELAAPVMVEIGPSPGGCRGGPCPTVAVSLLPKMSSYADPFLGGVASVGAEVGTN